MNLELLSVVVQTITAVAILFAGWQLLFHSRAMHRELEMAYVSRYWQLMDDRSPSFVLTREAGEGDEVVIFRYLQLCEDEIELRKLGRVTDATWKFWAKSMHQQASVRSYHAVLDQTPSDEFVFLRKLLKDGPEHDPMNQGWFRRRLGGL